MRLQNDDEEEYGHIGTKMPMIILAASLAVFVVLAVVLAANGKKNKTRSDYMKSSRDSEAVEEDTAEAADTLTASDLDFWDMYKQEVPSEDLTVQDDTPPEDAEPEEEPPEEETDPSTDGKHTQVTHPDGSTEWVDINSSLRLNDLEDTGFQAKNGIIGYYNGSTKTTRTGADLSQYTTVNDWDRLATEVDYVMIRVGARGYNTGKIIADTKFIENITEAAKHNIPYGVYFSSQAVTEDEAREEAAYVVSQLNAARTSVSSLNTTAASTDSTQSTTASTQNSTTTTTTDSDGNTTTVVLDEKGNSITTVKDKSGNTVKTTTVYTDPYGNVTTTVTDADGNQTINTVNNGQGASSSDTAQSTQSGTTTGYSFRLVYPVAVEMELADNDVSRIESMSSDQHTLVLSAFCDAVKTAGYTPMVMADKEFLICRLSLSSIQKYDTWLCNEGSLPDYPYQMSMWRYDTGNTLLASLSGQYGVDVSFIDYSIR